MSERWMGLHNHERHAPTSVTDMAWCNVCDGPCYSPEACRCCLAAEVESLRAGGAVAQAAAGKRIAELTAELADRDRRIEAALAFCDQHFSAATQAVGHILRGTQ